MRTTVNFKKNNTYQPLRYENLDIGDYFIPARLPLLEGEILIKTEDESNAIILSNGRTFNAYPHLEVIPLDSVTIQYTKAGGE
jgi:hypothetical protein